MSTGERLDVLVVDDDPNIRTSLRHLLEFAGHAVSESESGERALEMLEHAPAEVVLLDLDMPGMNGLDALVRIRQLAPETAVLIVTGQATARNAFLAAKREAYYFIEKPPDRDYLLDAVAKAGRVTRLRRAVTVAPAPAPVAEPASDIGILGRSAAIEALRGQIVLIGPSQGRVLITGENGSGKELVAHAIHALSKRAAGPFVKMNCAAIPKELVESELFGFERGAFTGAAQQKKGWLELAHAGTLFLDEIGDLSLEAQAKLLRAIETGEAERLGGTRTIQFDVRIVAATNKDLAIQIDSGDFRQDLYYSLNVLPVHVPPLRERVSDIAPLAEHFLGQFCRAESKPPKSLAPETRTLLEEYHWPGNVRELRNLMERVTVLVEGDVVEVADVERWLEAAQAPAEAVGLRGEVERREAEAIRRALDAASWNVTQAAAGLGIDRTNLHRKMRKYGITRR